PRFSTGCGQQDSSTRALSGSADAHSPWRTDQERPVSVPLLAAERDGGTHTGIGLLALRDDGEGRRVLARASLAGAGWHLPMVLDPVRRRVVLAASGSRSGALSA